MVRLALPLLVRVTDFAALVAPTVTVPKLRREDARDTPVPTPLSVTTWGLLESPSTMVRFPPRGPATLGVKVTVTVQRGIAFSGLQAFRRAGQLLVSEKSPLAEMLETA